MKKEVIIAILIGFGIGLIITFGIYKAQQAYQVSQSIPKTSSPPPSFQPSPILQLTLTSPQDQTVQSQELIVITGTTGPNHFITAVSSTTENFTQADSLGSFSIEVELVPGPNLITVTSIDELGNQNHQELHLVYREPTPSPSSTDTNQSTQSHDQN